MSGYHEYPWDEAAARVSRTAANPNPSSTGNLLGGVAANSPSNVWAVGAFNPGSQEQITRTLAFHCC